MSKKFSLIFEQQKKRQHSNLRLENSRSPLISTQKFKRESLNREFS